MERIPGRSDVAYEWEIRGGEDAPRARPVLDIRDLELVLALAETGTTVRAASRLHLTQSAVSRALATAEDKLGVALFARDRRGLQATAAGKRLVAGAGELLARFAALEEAARTAHAPAAVVLRVVCECYTAYRWLPSAMAKLAAAGVADVRVELAFAHTGDPVEALAAGEVDVALLTTGRVPRPLREAPLFEDEIVFVVGRSHALAEKAAITAADLRAHRLITASTTPDSERRWFAHAVFGGAARRGARIAPLAFPLTEAIVDAARAGMGIAVMSEWIASTYVAADPDGLIVKRLARPLRRPWRIAFTRDVEPSARRLASVLAGLVPHLATGRR